MCSDQVLASDLALDVPDEVIVRFNATVPPPVVPGLDLLGPLLAPAPPPAPRGGSVRQ